uniref:Uncharacterized protein n=1 Tax=Aegilops tauschii subsp. strangulata TaxID=200361 RepID=A0A452Y614_AEGTS
MCVPAKKSNSGPILLHLDSLGMHPTLEELMTAVVIFQIQQCILGTGSWSRLCSRIHTWPLNTLAGIRLFLTLKQFERMMVLERPSCCRLCDGSVVAFVDLLVRYLQVLVGLPVI